MQRNGRRLELRKGTIKEDIFDRLALTHTGELKPTTSLFMVII